MQWRCTAGSDSRKSNLIVPTQLQGRCILNWSCNASHRDGWNDTVGLRIAGADLSPNLFEYFSQGQAARTFLAPWKSGPSGPRFRRSPRRPSGPVAPLGLKCVRENYSSAPAGLDRFPLLTHG